MNRETLDYVRYRAARAEEALHVARRALDDGALHETVGRMYYACFYCVSALLLTEGHTSGRHNGVWTLFDLHWINTGRLPKEMGRFFHRLFRNRQDADCADMTTFDRADVEAWLHEAQEFITAVSNQIEKQIHLDTGKS